MPYLQNPPFLFTLTAPSFITQEHLCSKYHFSNRKKAVIYYIIKMMIQQKLEQKNLPIETENYNEKNYVGDDGTFVVPVEEVKEEEIEDADSSTE